MTCGATYLEALAELDKLRHALVHFILDDGLPLLREPLLLVCYKVAECRNKVGGWLLSGHLSAQKSLNVRFSSRPW
jgi:hypothetical protein